MKKLTIQNLKMAYIPIRMLRVLSFLLFLAPVVLFAQDESVILLGKKDSLYSEVLKEHRPYWISLPNSYEDTTASPQHYPVLVLLDARRNFQLAAGVVPFMSRNAQIPEMIIVAIPNTDRIRDLTPTYTLSGYEEAIDSSFTNSGGGDQFLKFLEDELLKEIDQSYRTMPFRILVGHSLGGTLACYAYLSRNKAFNAYIATDPSLWWDRQTLVEQAKSDRTHQQPFQSSLYISAAHHTMHTLDNSHMRKTQEAFFVALEEKGKKPLRVKFQHFEEEDHGTVPLSSLYHGLLFAFEGYHMPMDLIVKSEPEEINQHYEKFSKQVGVNFYPSESEMKLYADFYFYRTKEKNKGLAFYQMNVDNYPASYRAHQYLADALREMDQLEKAMRHYKRSLELNPDNEVVKKAISNLNTE